MPAAVVPSSTNVDRRAAPRRQPAVGTVFRIEDAAEERGFGLVWNISTSGISMLTPDNPGCGAKLRGNIVTNDGRHRQAIAVQIVHIRRIETGDYFVGAQFESPLTYTEMKPFLFE
jgi:hypothetical protein